MPLDAENANSLSKHVFGFLLIHITHSEQLCCRSKLLRFVAHAAQERDDYDLRVSVLLFGSEHTAPQKYTGGNWLPLFQLATRNEHTFALFCRKKDASCPSVSPCDACAVSELNSTVEWKARKANRAPLYHTRGTGMTIVLHWGKLICSLGFPFASFCRRHGRYVPSTV